MSDKIKYHDNNIYPASGPDGERLDNWNPEAPYPADAFCRVHIRINTPGFDCGSFEDDKDRDIWLLAVERLKLKLGFSLSSMQSIYCLSEDWKEGLFFHPQDISGVLRKRNVQAVTEAIADDGFLTVRWVDIYQDVYDLSVAQSRKRLRRDEVVNDILEAAITKRRDLFKRVDEVARRVAEKHDVYTLENSLFNAQFGLSVQSAVVELIAELGAAGYLIFPDNAAYVRTINKTEQKQRKLSLENVKFFGEAG